LLKLDSVTHRQAVTTLLFAFIKAEKKHDQAHAMALLDECRDRLTHKRYPTDVLIESLIP